MIESVFAVTENLYSVRGRTLRANARGAGDSRQPGLDCCDSLAGLDESERLVQPHIRTGKSHRASGHGWLRHTPGPCSTCWADHTAAVSPAANERGALLPRVTCGYTPAQDPRGLWFYERHEHDRQKGVRVGITDAFASPTIVDDVNRFSANYGLPLLNASNFKQIVVPGTFNFPENQFDPAG